METKFTKAMEYFNSIINQVEKGSKEYKLMCLLKYDTYKIIKKVA